MCFDQLGYVIQSSCHILDIWYQVKMSLVGFPAWVGAQHNMGAERVEVFLGVGDNFHGVQ
jgi:hypothetical protein